MFEEHHDGLAFTIDHSVLHHCDHTINIHVLTSEELEILESADKFLHDFVHVGLERIWFGASSRNPSSIGCRISCLRRRSSRPVCGPWQCRSQIRWPHRSLRRHLQPRDWIPPVEYLRV